DYVKAREWWEKAAQKGDGDAMFGLGYLYENGQGVARDYAKARQWAALLAKWPESARLGHFGYKISFIALIELPICGHSRADDRFPGDLSCPPVVMGRSDGGEPAEVDQNFGCADCVFPISGGSGSEGADISQVEDILRPSLQEIEQFLCGRKE